jgi:hypothetical protein
MPDPIFRELYQDHEEFSAWWRVRNPIAVRFDSLDAIPGRGCASGQGAPYVFRGQVSFAYWDFRDASFQDLVGSAVVAKPRVTLPVNSPTPVSSASRMATKRREGELWPRPEIALYGVDFSGGKGDPQYGNRKIWVAKWSPGNEVSLKCGWCGNIEEKISRRDLAALILREPGWWSLDFPFGIARKTAHALGLNRWSEWLQWCANEADATKRRDEARKLTTQSGIAWGERRQVDHAHKTTWFPLFEQLYRQTIYGGSEVLLPLHDQGACVLPWRLNALENSAVVVVEGFPGATISTRLLGRRPSYKGRTNAHRAERENIINAIMSGPFGIPVSDEVVRIAVDDQDGDALDALILLIGSWIAWRLPVKNWEQQLALLEGDGATVEGWFPF